MATWSPGEADPLGAFADDEVAMILGSTSVAPPPALLSASKAARETYAAAPAVPAAAAARTPIPPAVAAAGGASAADAEAALRGREGVYGQHVIDGYPLLRMASFDQLGILLQHDEGAPDDERKALRLALLGGELMERERLDDAELLLKRAFRVYKELTGADNIAVLLRLGCLYQQKLDLPIAIKFFEKGLQVAQERGAPDPTLLFGHVGLASSYRMASDMDRAEAYCTQLLTDGFVPLRQPIERAVRTDRRAPPAHPRRPPLTALFPAHGTHRTHSTCASWC
jgi:tetratricopeptide (TPR) repeat protein